MALEQVMLIRHAEKPSAAVGGVALDGTPDAESLIPQGWQRAGALVRFFNPITPRPEGALISTPDALFAAGVGPGSKSRRSIETVSALAQSLELRAVPFIKNHLKDSLKEMTDDVITRDGVALIAWEHKLIPSIVHILTDGAITPGPWPDDRFDMVWILRKTDGRWILKEELQRLLPGDQGENL